MCATRTRKTPAKTGAVSPLLSAVVESAIAHLPKAAALHAAFEEASKSSKGVWQGFMDVVAACKTLPELYALLGNGKNNKAKDFEAGQIVEAIKLGAAAHKLNDDDAKKVSDSLKSQASKARTIGRAKIEKGYTLDATLGRDKQVAAAQLALDGGTAKAKETTPKAGESKTDTVEQLITKFGLAVVLQHCAAILGSTKATAVQAAAVAAVASQIKAA